MILKKQTNKKTPQPHNEVQAPNLKLSEAARPLLLVPASLSCPGSVLTAHVDSQSEELVISLNAAIN